MSRIAAYPIVELETGIRVHVARTWRARLLGLALVKKLDRDEALIIPRCTSIHTFGMRFPIDVVFADHEWLPVHVELGVGPRRMLSNRYAHSVIEVAAGEAGRLVDGLRRRRALAGGKSAPTAPAPRSR